LLAKCTWQDLSNFELASRKSKKAKRGGADMKTGWLKRILSGDGDYPPKQQRQRIFLLVGAIVIGLALINLGNSSKSSSDSVQKQAGSEPAQAQQLNSSSAMMQEEEILAGRLKNMLSQLSGAGQVDVNVRLETSRRDRYAVNTTSGRKTTEEKDQAGGTRLTNENTENDQLVLVRTGQGENPVVEEEQASRIAGVLVVAQGAKDSEVKARIFRAVQVALGIEPQKILVLPAQGGE
jgi:stage III sporulation protein AG